MDILLIGSGGREHAFAVKILESPECTNLYVAPGNAGTAQIAKNINIKETDFKGLRRFILANKIQMVVVGPEEPLVRGIRDFLANDVATSHVLVVGPSQQGAALEGSKDFSKKFMARHQIPTAAYHTFTHETLENGLEFISHQNPPIVLKADGLAGGKGVLITSSRQEAKDCLKEMIVDAKFGEASQKVVIEEYLEGIELSVFVATDGENYKILPEAKDYKRIGEKDTGLNTGGMGAVSPVPFADKSFMNKVERQIVRPTVDGLHKEKIDYKGFLFIGLMNINGEPKVIEYNVRMGDPETQAVLPRIKSDFVKLLRAVGNGTLVDYELEIEPICTTTVVMVADGYPGSYEKGEKIEGLDADGNTSLTFHAGTQLGENGDILTNGGRVLGITGKGDSTEEAIANAYERVGQIAWPKQYFRRDIGQDILNYGK